MTSRLIALALCLFAQSALHPVEPKSVGLPGFSVIGVSTRTNNKDEMSGSGKIGPLWKSYSESASHIANVTGPDTFSIYTGYDNDENGALHCVWFSCPPIAVTTFIPRCGAHSK